MMTTRYQISPGWEAAIDAWTAHMIMRALSPATRRVRRDHIRYIARRSAATGPADLSAADLLSLCSVPAWSAAHRDALRGSLNSFYGYCVAAGLATDNPAAGIPPVRTHPACPRPATDEIWAGLLAAATPREQLMARLAAEAGLRRAEVAQVHSNDLMHDADGWSLIVHGKGGKQRVVPLTERLGAAVHAHRAHGYLFPGHCNGHISVVYVGQLISALMPAGWSMHKLRHRYATRGYAATGNLRAVQECLGHASVGTTQRYTAVSSKEMRSVSEAAS